MNLSVFMLFTTLGTFIWNAVLVWLGVYAGASWEKIVNYMNTYSTIALVLLIVVGMAFVYRLFKRRSEVTAINQRHE